MARRGDAVLPVDLAPAPVQQAAILAAEAAAASVVDVDDADAARGEELRLQVANSPVMTLRGEQRSLDLPVVTSDHVAELFRTIATDQQMEELEQCGNIHFIYVFENRARFSVTAVMQHQDLNLKIKNLSP